LDYVREERGEEVVTALVANKVDMDADRLHIIEMIRAVKREDAEKFAKDNELLYFEVSAKEGTNVQNFFKQIAQLLIGDVHTDQDSQVNAEGNQDNWMLGQQKAPEKVNLKAETAKTP
jgi:GTPase SAR1 family protein